MRILAPSILSADFRYLERDIKAVSQAGAKCLHIDVMDGMFVPSISFGMPVISSIRGCTDLFFDVHMMVTEPGRYVQAMRESGADSITVHVEACADVKDTLESVRKTGAAVGLSLNPATPVEAVYPYLAMVDMILVMTVNPGFGGQKYIPETLKKVSALRQKRQELDLDFQIEVDGGVNSDTLPEFLEAGSEIIVAGSAVFRGDAAENTRRFLDAIKES